MRGYPKHFFYSILFEYPDKKQIDDLKLREIIKDIEN